MNDLLVDELLASIIKTQNITDEDEKLYEDALNKYKKAFGYYPFFIALPDPTTEQILNAVETGVELYEKESTNSDIIL